MSGSRYSPKEINVALAAFAIEGGRRKGVEALLRAAQVKVSYSTVRRWAYDTHHRRYEQIAAELEKQVRTQLADQWRSLARTSVERTEDFYDRIEAQLKWHDSQMHEVEAAIERLGDPGEDDKDALKLRMQLWKRAEGLRIGLCDLAKLLHESGVIGGIATEKLALLTGQPTERVEHSFPELKAALEAKGIRLVTSQGQTPLPPPVPTLPAGDG